jgi:hypothetical protein
MALHEFIPSSSLADLLELINSGDEQTRIFL